MMTVIKQYTINHGEMWLLEPEHMSDTHLCDTSPGLAVVSSRTCSV